jgi:hypothetical protein
MDPDTAADSGHTVEVGGRSLGRARVADDTLFAATRTAAVEFAPRRGATSLTPKESTQEKRTYNVANNKFDFLEIGMC